MRDRKAAAGCLKRKELCVCMHRLHAPTELSECNLGNILMELAMAPLCVSLRQVSSWANMSMIVTQADLMLDQPERRAFMEGIAEDYEQQLQVLKEVRLPLLHACMAAKAPSGSDSSLELSSATPALPRDTCYVCLNMFM